jgi:hypothetical protein
MQSFAYERLSTQFPLRFRTPKPSSLNCLERSRVNQCKGYSAMYSTLRQTVIKSRQSSRTLPVPVPTPQSLRTYGTLFRPFARGAPHCQCGLKLQHICGDFPSRSRRSPHHHIMSGFRERRSGHGGTQDPHHPGCDSLFVLYCIQQAGARRCLSPGLGFALHDM